MAAPRFEVIPCATEPDLFVIWDKVEEQVIDVLTASEVEAYDLEDAL